LGRTKLLRHKSKTSGRLALIHTKISRAV